MIPGMTGPMSVVSGAVLPPLLGISEFSFTSNSNGNIAWPVGRLAGDVAVLFDVKAAYSGSPGNYSVASGFTRAASYDPSISGGTQTMVAQYRMLDGTETGNISGMSNDMQHKYLALYRGTNRRILNVTADAWFALGSNNPPATNINATTGSAPKAVFGWLSNLGVGNFAIQTPAFVTQSNRTTDPPGSGDDYVSRFYRTLYQRYDTLFNHTVDYNSPAVMAGGQLLFS